MENNIITIDFGVWTTQAAKAKEKGCSIQYISKLVKLGKLESFIIPVIGTVLVKK